MESRFLVDTNILIYSFSKVIPKKIQDIITPIYLDSFNISVINQIEFLGWRELNDQEFNQAIRFINNARVYSISDRIVDETIKIRRDVKIKIPDAIIAATCLVNDFVLLTRNTSDFLTIEGLKFLDPFEQ